MNENHSISNTMSECVCVYASFAHNRISALDPSVNDCILLLLSHWIYDTFYWHWFHFQNIYFFPSMRLLRMSAWLTVISYLEILFIFAELGSGAEQTRGKLGKMWVDGAKKLERFSTFEFLVIMPSINDCSSFAYPNRFSFCTIVWKREVIKDFFSAVCLFFGSEISHN